MRQVVDLCKNAKSPLTGGPVHVVAAGGIFDGRGLAAALCWGAQVWISHWDVPACQPGAGSTQMNIFPLFSSFYDCQQQRFKAAWVGTRFVCAKEAGAPPRHQQAIIDADVHSTVRTIIFTGRPLRVLNNSYIENWEQNRRDEIQDLTSRGIIPFKV